MDAWEFLWKVVFWGGLGLFAIMAVWVTIFGFRDILRLLRSMREAGEDGDDDSDLRAP